LIEWTARHYLAPAGTVAKLALPEYLTAAKPTPGSVPSPDAPLPGRTASRRILIKRRRLADYRQLVSDAGRFLLLVPEIALAESFGDLERGSGAVRFHSQLPPAERRRIWSGVAAGSITKVVGTRAALWLPWPGLELVIIDEEDDRAYKSERTPRYHARTVGTKLAALHQADLVLASAAPSLETWQHGQERDWDFEVEREAFPTVIRTGVGTAAEPLDSVSLEQLRKPGRHVVWTPERSRSAVASAIKRAIPSVPLTTFAQRYGSRALVAGFTGRPDGVLIGSTALTHPWDFQSTNVVVTGLDALLQLADFRSAERAHGILRKLAAHATGT
jgi:primosomal protein N'